MTAERISADEARCPVHGEPFIVPDCPDGFQRCTFYIPELGADEDYGCPQPEGDFR